MPRNTNPHCLSCAQITSQEAHQRSCWDDMRCHNRRNYYRTKLNALATPSALDSNTSPPIAVLDVPLPQVAHAMLYCYMEGSALHAVQAELYRGSQLIARTVPLHVGSLTEGVLRAYLQSILEAFVIEAKAPVSQFRNQLSLPLNRYKCPVEGCWSHV